MPNVRLATLRVWRLLLEMQMKGKVSKKFLNILLWIFLVISTLGICSFGKKDVMLPCGLAKPATAWGVLWQNWRRNLLPPSTPPNFLLGRPIASQAGATMLQASQDELRKLAGKLGPAELFSMYVFTQFSSSPPSFPLPHLDTCECLHKARH